MLVLSLDKAIRDFLIKSSITPRKGPIFQFLLHSPWLPHKHNDRFPSTASRTLDQLCSLYLDVWEVHSMATTCGNVGKPTHSPEAVSYPMDQLEHWKYQPAVNDQFISSLMGSTLQNVKSFLEVVLHLKPEILNFRMNLSIFMNCRIPYAIIFILS